ncbi:MAG: hypothetical protein ABSE93_22715 [Terriglobia bacterium]
MANYLTALVSDLRNVLVHREFGGSWIVELDYVGNHGVPLPGDLEYDYIASRDRALGSEPLEIVNNLYYGVINSGPLSMPQATRSGENRPAFRTPGPKSDSARAKR